MIDLINVIYAQIIIVKKILKKKEVIHLIVIIHLHVKGNIFMLDRFIIGDNTNLMIKKL